MKTFRTQTLLAGLMVAGSLSIAAPQSNDPYATAEELGLMKGFPPAPEMRVTKENALLTAPYNRWSYLNMRRFYPSAPIATAEKASHMAREIDSSLEKIRVPQLDKPEVLNMEQYLRQSYADSLVVIQGDKVVYEKYLNGMDADHPHQMMSVTKSFAGLLALMAAEVGKINEADPVTTYVPALKSASAFGDATVGQVMDMTNSMDYNEDYADPASGVHTYGAVIGWTEPDPNREYPASLYDYLKSLPAEKGLAHGEVFHYQTPKTDVVNWITNRAYNKSFQEIMAEKLWSKIGTDGETYVLLDKHATLVAGGGLNATPNDLARFSAMMLNGGKANRQQVVPASVIDTLKKGGSIEAFDNGPDSDGIVHPKGEWSYRAQWWIRHTEGKEAIMAIGIHGQWIYVDVERNIAIVKQSSQPKSKGTAINKLDLNAFDAIVEHLSRK